MDRQEKIEKVDIKGRRDEDMNTALAENDKYKPLDLKVLKNKKSSTLSYEESLEGIEPIDWSDEVLSGKKKVEFSEDK